MVSVGTIVWLSSELMFFSALFAMYFSIRAASPSSGPLSWPYHTEHLDVYYALPFTVILVLSSITCLIGGFAAERNDVCALRRWFSSTFILGLIFLLGQANEYRMNVHEGYIMLNRDGYGSMFYLTTGFHGLHVTGGLIAFLFVLGRTFVARRFTHEQAVTAIVVSYYWHFVDVVWIALFATIYLIK